MISFQNCKESAYWDENGMFHPARAMVLKSPLAQDHRKLCKAAGNPWHVLSTLYGDDLSVNMSALERWQKSAPNDEDHAQFQKRMGGAIAIPPHERGIFFSHTLFSETVYLGNLDLIRDFHCEAAVFERFFIAENVNFCAGARFGKTQFRAIANFQGSRFDHIARFEDTEFHGNALFQSTIYNAPVRFGRAHFASVANFRGSEFSTSEYVLDALVSRSGFQDGGMRSSNIDFRAARFSGPTSFEDVKFQTDVPSFHGVAHFFDDTRFCHSVKNWPRLEHPELQIRNYERILALCAQSQFHDDELFFARQTNWSKERLDWRAGRIGSFLFSRIYGIVSDYGRSWSRPLFALTLLWAMGVWVFFSYFLSAANEPVIIAQRGDGSLFALAARLSLSNLFSIFGMGWLYFGDLYKTLGSSVKSFAMIQTCFGALLLFLFGLGARSRFRLYR